MTLQTLFQILDRYGFPTCAFVAIIWLLVLFIRGPVDTFSAALASKVGRALDTGSDFMEKASAALGQLPGQIAAEGDATRAAVTTAATEIKAAIAGTTVTLVQLSEPVSTSAPVVQPSQPSGGPPPLPLPEPRATLTTVPEGSSKPRGALVTLPSASVAAPVSEPFPA